MDPLHSHEGLLAGDHNWGASTTVHARAGNHTGGARDDYRNRSFSSERMRSRPLPRAVLARPRIIAMGTRSALPITNSAAEANSSAIAMIVACNNFPLA